MSVGTPFMRYGPSLGILWRLLPLSFVLLVVTLTMPIVWQAYAANLSDILQFPDVWLVLVVPLLCAVLIGTAGLFTTNLVGCARSMLQERRLEGIRAECFTHIAGRFFPLASAHDEAINGLAGSLAFSGEIVPRAGGIAWLYDRLLAAAGDDFIWTQLSRRTQGSDIPGLVLRDVSSMPRRHEGGLLLSETIDRDLERRANEKVQAVAADLRAAMQRVAYGGYPIDYLRAAAVEGGAVQSLIHTSYFDLPEVQVLIVAHLRGESVAEVQKRELVTIPSPARRSPVRVTLPLLVNGMIAVSTLWIGVTLRDLVLPLGGEEMLRRAARELPFVQATYEGTYGRESIPFRLLALLAANGMDEMAAEFIDQTEEKSLVRHRAWAAVAEGLIAGGQLSRAQRFLDEAIQVVRVRKALPKGLEGPEEVASEEALDLVVALARSRRLDEIEQILTRDEVMSDSARSLILDAAVIGLTRAGDLDPVPSMVRRISRSDLRSDAFARLVRASPRWETGMALLPLFAGSELQDALALIVQAKSASASISEQDALLTQISESGARVVAVTAMAKVAAKNGDTEAAARLLEREVDALRARRREPFDGGVINYVRLADGFLSIGRRDRSEAVLAYGEKLPLQKRDGVTYLESGGWELAYLWARLGVVDGAIRGWLEQRRFTGAPEGLLEMIVGVLVEAGKAEEVRKSVVANGSAYDQLLAELGIFDVERRRASSNQQFRALDVLTRRIGALKDPSNRSELLGEAAVRWASIGNIRRAHLVSRSCFPVDRARVLNHLLVVRRAGIGLLEFGFPR